MTLRQETVSSVITSTKFKDKFNYFRPFQCKQPIDCIIIAQCISGVICDALILVAELIFPKSNILSAILLL